MGAATEADDREYLQPPERPPRRFVTAKYVCIAVSILALVLLAIALSYPISNLLGIKRLDDAYKSANVSDNEIDDTAPDGFQPTRDGYKRDVTETGAPPPPPPPPPPETSTPARTTESSTPAATTESTTPTTSTTQSTTQPTTTTTVTRETTTTTTTTEEPSTSRSTRRHRRSHREEPDPTTTESPSNRTSRPSVWLNRTRSPAVPGYLVYEVAMKKVSVQLVYECHCPRSRRFIVSQLLPVYELLREYMHLTLLPFGRARIENGTGGGNDTASNATTTTTPSSANSTVEPGSAESAESAEEIGPAHSGSNNTDGNSNNTDGNSNNTDGNSNNTYSDGSNGTSSDRNSTSSPTIRCPRGEDECRGSMVQTCVMRHVEETLTAVRIIACMSRYPDPHHVGRRCVEKHGLEWHLVDQCVTEEGKLLMLDMGKQTWSITSSVNSVPLIRIQGESSHVIQVEAQTNLLSLICARLQNRPPACQGRRNATQSALPGNGTETTEAPSRTTSAAPPSTGC
uniref:Gamma-interferon inducible lysosomal thiol reductase n=1 Tax=Rhipicephalus zambeziensis TaxID=60191 RepID=A0A224YZ80_9ACAR